MLGKRSTPPHRAFPALVLCCLGWAPARPAADGLGLTPKGDLGLVAVTLEVPPVYRADAPAGRQVLLPPGFAAKIFYAGKLDKPRFLAWGPDSVLYVANKNSGEVLALPDRDRDGAADTAMVAASGLGAIHDLKFFRGKLYVTETTKVWELSDKDHDGVYETKGVWIQNLPSGAKLPGGGHDTRTLAFDSARGKAYLSVGSSCNVCREDERAVILEYDLNGSGGRIYASGARNAVGLALHPRTGRLWATNNNSDNQGNEIPPEWIDLVRDGGFYGWPFAWGAGTYFDFGKTPEYRALLPITPADSAKVRRMVKPAALITAHSAPMAIQFPTVAFPAAFRRGAFVALRGSWNRRPYTGYKVIYLDFDHDRDTTANTASDFLSGFLTDSASGAAWARPVGLAADLRGNLYVTSDERNEFILRVSPTGASRAGPRPKARARRAGRGAAPTLNGSGSRPRRPT